METFVRKETLYAGTLNDSTSLQRDIGVYGDDMDELLTAYLKEFKVDMSGFLWYFHTGEEGINLSWLLLPKGRRVSEIPITIGMLHRFAESGRWEMEYPPHTTPKPRIWLELLALVVFGGCVAMAFLRSLGR